MQRRTRKFAGIVSALALLSAAPAFATTLEKMTMEEMAQSADIVVVGSPTDVVVVRDNGQVLTHTTFEVSADAFGGAPSTLTVVTPGGRTNMGMLQVAEVVAGAPAFAGGSDSMLFLNERESGTYEVTGFNQGYYGIANGAVHFAPEDGGATDIAEALEQIRQARNADADQIIED